MSRGEDQLAEVVGIIPRRSVGFPGDGRRGGAARAAWRAHSGPAKAVRGRRGLVDDAWSGTELFVGREPAATAQNGSDSKNRRRLCFRWRMKEEVFQGLFCKKEKC